MENRQPIFTDLFIQDYENLILPPSGLSQFIHQMSFPANEVTMASSYRLFFESYLALTKICLPNTRHSTTSHFRTATE